MKIYIRKSIWTIGIPSLLCFLTPLQEMPGKVQNPSFEKHTGYNGGENSIIPHWKGMPYTFGYVRKTKKKFTEGLDEKQSLSLSGGIYQKLDITFEKKTTYILTIKIGKPIGAPQFIDKAGITFGFKAADLSEYLSNAELFIGASDIYKIPEGTFKTYSIEYEPSKEMVEQPVIIALDDFLSFEPPEGIGPPDAGDHYQIDLVELSIK